MVQEQLCSGSMAQQHKRTDSAAGLPFYRLLLGKIVRGDEKRKKDVLRRGKNGLGEIDADHRGVTKHDAGADYRQVAGTVAGCIAVICTGMVCFRAGGAVSMRSGSIDRFVLLAVMQAEGRTGSVSFMAEAGRSGTENNGNQQNRQKFME